MSFHVDDPDHPFDPDGQIQPSSIDLRLSNVFWRPSRRAVWRRRLGRRRALDLRRSDLQELEPRRDWKKVSLGPGESETLKPGGVLMARIFERFEVPPDYAGKIEGRSSFSRLGLMVHCTGDFINPGWSGYMPLQLFNAGPFPIRIYPYLPICQLMVVKLSSTPTRTYGDATLQSKYVNDDGGPSYWWRDQRIERLQSKLARANLSLRVREDIVRLIRFEDPDLLEHFENYVARQRVGKFESADAILSAFSEREERRRWIDRVGKGLFPLLAAASVSALFVPPYATLHFVLWSLTALSAGWAVHAWFWQPAEYLGKKEVATARAAAEKKAAE